MMVEKIKKDKSLILTAFLFISSFVLRIIGFVDKYQNIMAIFVFSICTFLVLTKIKTITKNRINLTLFIVSYLIHIGFLMVDIYYKPVFMNGGDCQNFYDTTVMYYQGDFSRIYTNYPYLLYCIFLIFGPSRFIVQYTNVLLWVVNLVVVNKILDLLKAKTIYKNAVMFFLLFSPIYTCFTSILLRDTLVSTCVVFSLYYLIKWMQDDNVKYIIFAFLSTIPGLIMHVGTLAITGSVVLIASFYSHQEKKMKFQNKTLIILSVGVLTLIVSFAIPFIRTKIFNYIPSFENFNLIDYCNRSIAARPIGGSQYLTDAYVNNYFELFITTIRRFYYFYLAPLPANWRSIKDVATFVADSMIFLSMFILVIISVLKKNWNSIKTTLIIYILSFGMFFSWAVTNGGTALRHRQKMYCVVVLAIFYFIKDLIIKKEN